MSGGWTLDTQSNSLTVDLSEDIKRYRYMDTVTRLEQVIY